MLDRHVETELLDVRTQQMCSRDVEIDRLDSLLATAAPIWLLLHYLVF